MYMGDIYSLLLFTNSLLIHYQVLFGQDFRVIFILVGVARGKNIIEEVICFQHFCFFWYNVNEPAPVQKYKMSSGIEIHRFNSS